ncbi:chemotaxis protein CheX [Yoonia maricola]|uniref:Chemotaxis protein CheX n=1 Tax=Yoonia maricola TaxID=420999 RepID=A0A2M8W1X2_9RHOB|nr:STAS domain-containing protein [Yoonia maricola]PJI84932.1 chemotaxis protein CheX [Yoonia maricola]
MTDDTARFELSPIMKIEDCERLHSFLAGTTDQDIEIDCGAVDRLSGLTAQMLVVGRGSWHRNGRNFTLSNPSEGFEQGIALLGLTDVMSQDQVAA